MHELSLVYQVVKTVEGVMEEQGLSELEQITLDIGEMTDVVPKFIEEAWLVAKESTKFPSAKMKINVITATAKCVDCGYTDNVLGFDYECPKCKSTNLKIISGREFEIKEIVAK